MLLLREAVSDLNLTELSPVYSQPMCEQLVPGQVKT